MKSEKAAKRYAREETRSKAVREFLLSFQLPIIQPVPETPRHQCVGCYLCVCLNGATGPPLHNEARPFAVTPPHQEDREARNKKAGSEKEKEGERGRIKNGGGVEEESVWWCGGEAPTAERGEGDGADGPLARFKTGRIKERWFGQKPEKTQREAAREGERGRGLAPDLGTL